jgi:hypothetical protein
MKIEVFKQLRKSGPQASHDELVLVLEVAAVSPVPQDGERILTRRMQVEVAALS